MLPLPSQGRLIHYPRTRDARTGGRGPPAPWEPHRPPPKPRAVVRPTRRRWFGTRLDGLEDPLGQTIVRQQGLGGRPIRAVHRAGGGYRPRYRRRTGAAACGRPGAGCASTAGGRDRIMTRTASPAAGFERTPPSKRGRCAACIAWAPVGFPAAHQARRLGQRLPSIRGRGVPRDGPAGMQHRGLGDGGVGGGHAADPIDGSAVRDEDRALEAEATRQLFPHRAGVEHQPPEAGTDVLEGVSMDPADMAPVDVECSVEADGAEAGDGIDPDRADATRRGCRPARPRGGTWQAAARGRG